MSEIQKWAGEIQKWADTAMFKAEPLKASDGPKVFLLAGTPDPLGAVAAMAKMYKGEVVRSMADVSDDERRDYLAQILKTKLKAPLEAVKIHFMVEGVTRSFTHQMVRQRTAVYAQESLRFAVKEDMAEGVALPPSLQRYNQPLPTDESVTLGDYLWGQWRDDGQGKFTDYPSAPLDKQYIIWRETVDLIGANYSLLVNTGMPAEDARGLLPHNVTTRLNYVTDMRALQDHAGNRLCTQAQFEWRLVWVKIIEAMRGYCTNSYCGGGIVHRHASGPEDEGHPGCDNWQWSALADVFRPVCYLTGKCEFMADFDRACSIRERVEANHAIGRPSSEWGNPHTTTREVSCSDPQCGDNPWDPVCDGRKEVVKIGAIQPAEWLMDDAAARVQ